MSNIYDALHLAQGKKLPGSNELKTEEPTALPHPLTSSYPLSTQMFHERSELLALAQNIATHLPDPNQRVIQFIGSRPGEGTSTLIRELALTVAQQSSKPVLLVEADSDHPSQAQAFGLEAKPHIDFALKDRKPFDGVLTQIEQSNLFLGSLSSQFFRSLTDRSFFHSTDMWQAARDQFSLILIDSAPVNASADGLAICETVNGVILVLAAEHTRSAVAQNVKREILKREGNLIGIVFTKRKFHIPPSIHKLL
jgi:Mrp family chromosome partitioning ATPase